MSKPMWSRSEKSHGRIDTCYNSRIEIVPHYGLAIRDRETKKLYFLCEHSFDMSWSELNTFARSNPPRIDQYPEIDKTKYDVFVVNFRKKTSPVKLGDRISKYNFEVTSK